MPCRRYARGGLIALALVSAPGLALAQEQADYSETITVEAPRLIDMSTSAATVIDVERERGRGEEIVDVLARTPGVSLRRSGALGSFSSIAIRGIGGRNVGVVLDDLPLASVTLGPIDFSLIPLESVSSIEVYRGIGPVRYSGPLAGVVRLQTEEPGAAARVRGEAGYGSFTTRTASVSASGPIGDFGYAAALTYQGTRGDFTYYDDRETLYTTADDRRLRRTNNGNNAGSARLKLTHRGPADSVVRWTTNLLLRDQGVAGSGARQTSETHASDAEILSRLVLDSVQLGRLVLTTGTDVLHARRVFDDPLDEVGLSIANSTSQVLQLGLDERATYTWSNAQSSELAPRVSVERFQQTGAASSPSFAARELDRTRLLVGSGVEHRATFETLTVVPSLRFDLEHNRGTAVRGVGTVTQGSPRLGALVAVGGCDVRANAGRFHRLPTTSERFGDGVTTVANPNLLPERGLSADAGVRCRVAHFEGELTGFATEADRLIVLVQNSQLTGIATNIGATRIVGFESFARLTWPWLDTAATYTLTSTRDVSDNATRGNRTPGIPLHDAHGRVQVGPDVLHIRYDIDVRSSVFLDNGNARPVPTRVLHDVALEASLPHSSVSLAITVRNLTNLIVEDVDIAGASAPVPSKVADYLGYPLPGRSVFVSLLWRSS